MSFKKETVIKHLTQNNELTEKKTPGLISF